MREIIPAGHSGLDATSVWTILIPMTLMRANTNTRRIRNETLRSYRGAKRRKARDTRNTLGRDFCSARVVHFIEHLSPICSVLPQPLPTVQLRIHLHKQEPATALQSSPPRAFHGFAAAFVCSLVICVNTYHSTSRAPSSCTRHALPLSTVCHIYPTHETSPSLSIVWIRLRITRFV